MYIVVYGLFYLASKSCQAEMREEAQRRARERAEEIRKEQAERKREHDRFGVKQQIEVRSNECFLF